MHTLAAAMITTKQAMTEGARSALPDAPVVPYVEKTPVGWRTRATVADALRHVADVVASPLVAWRIKLRRSSRSVTWHRPANDPARLPTRPKPRPSPPKHSTSKEA